MQRQNMPGWYKTSSGDYCIKVDRLDQLLVGRRRVDFHISWKTENENPFLPKANGNSEEHPTSSTPMVWPRKKLDILILLMKIVSFLVVLLNQFDLSRHNSLRWSNENMIAQQHHHLVSLGKLCWADTISLVAQLLHRSKAHLQSMILLKNGAVIVDFYVHLVDAILELTQHIHRTTAKLLLHINGSWRKHTPRLKLTKCGRSGL